VQGVEPNDATFFVEKHVKKLKDTLDELV